MPIGNKHEHVHKLQVIDVVADNPNYDADKYGFKSFLADVCECGHIRPLRYGERKAMHKLFDDMQAQQLSEGKTE